MRPRSSRKGPSTCLRVSARVPSSSPSRTSAGSRSPARGGKCRQYKPKKEMSTMVDRFSSELPVYPPLFRQTTSSDVKKGSRLAILKRCTHSALARRQECWDESRPKHRSTKKKSAPMQSKQLSQAATSLQPHGGARLLVPFCLGRFGCPWLG